MKIKLTFFLVVVAAVSAQANISAITDPGGTTTEIGARIRWGNTGFEASIWDNSPFVQNPTLNPSGSPVWALGNAYKFKVDYTSTTGTLTLAVDFNRDDSFAAGETISRSVFSAPGQTSYTGYGFNYLSISGNESGSTARSQVSNLVINGASMSSLAPNGAFLEQFYGSGNLLTSITITGDLTFSTAGTSQERPSWNFNLKNSAQPVPAPGAALLALIGMPIVGWVKRRFA